MVRGTHSENCRKGTQCIPLTPTLSPGGEGDGVQFFPLTVARDIRSL